MYDLAIFPGDFNPFHYGHINALVKASRCVSKILLFLIDVSAERRIVTPPPILDLEMRHRLVGRYISEGYLKKVNTQYELYSGDQAFDDVYLNDPYVLILGSDVFNYRRFDADDPRYEEFGWLIENSRIGIVLVERPGYPPDKTILAWLETRGVNVEIFQGDKAISARGIRKKISRGKAITGMVPDSLEKEIIEKYQSMTAT